MVNIRRRNEAESRKREGEEKSGGCAGVDRPRGSIARVPRAI